MGKGADANCIVVKIERNAALVLVEERYLLADEVDLVVDQAAQRYDLLHQQVPQAQAADG